MEISPVELLLRVSAASVGAGEQPPNTNSGPYVKRVLARTGNKERDPWCASQVTDWGVLALGNQWPVARSASVVTIVEWAKAHGCLRVPNWIDDGVPRIGDLYAVWYAKKNRFAHIGLIIDVGEAFTVEVRDGNTSSPHDTDPARQREGWLVAEKPRVLTLKDRLIRWTTALPDAIGP